MNTATAGTLESMDCMVTATPMPTGSGISVQLEGSSVRRFKKVMEATIRSTLAELGADDVQILVNDHGALDVVLEARVEAAVRRMRGEN